MSGVPGLYLWQSKVWRQPEPRTAIGVAQQKSAKGKCRLHKEFPSETVFILLHPDILLLPSTLECSCGNYLTTSDHLKLKISEINKGIENAHVKPKPFASKILYYISWSVQWWALTVYCRDSNWEIQVDSVLWSPEYTKYIFSCMCIGTKKLANSGFFLLIWTWGQTAVRNDSRAIIFLEGQFSKRVNKVAANLVLNLFQPLLQIPRALAKYWPGYHKIGW